ncbi:MAG: hypothetical protein WA139_00980 [Candidatus Aenigmatarchaeota archaeon]
MFTDFLGSRKWKEKMHYSIKAQLNEMIKRSRSHEEIYKSASNPTAAQIWCAIAELTTDVKFLEIRLKRIEEALKQPREEISKDVEEL